VPRYAVLSDIHANLEALTSVLRALDDQNIDQIYNLGDSVGYHTNPNECLDLIRSRNIPSVMGNHDRCAAGLAEPTHFTDTARAAIFWTRAHLTPAHKQYLSELTPTLTPVEDTVLVHAALHPEPNDELRITSEHIAHKSFEQMRVLFPSARICFFGHTHRAAAYAHNHITTPAPVEPSSNTVHLRPDSLYLINPGSVGQPRDHDLRAAYAIYDQDAQTITFHRADYDLLTTKQKLSRSGILPRHPFLSRLSRLIGIG
jgi:predicted phosphodiesterase